MNRRNGHIMGNLGGLASWREENMGRVAVAAKVLFGVWLVGITVLAVVPHADDGLMVKTNVTASGMEKHMVGYFVGTWLLYYGYGKKGARSKEQGARREDQVIRNKNSLAQRRPRETKERGFHGASKGAKIYWMSGLIIFGYSVVLEGVQIFLPYRTFNPYDILGNGVGVGVFCLVCLARRRKLDGSFLEDKRDSG